MSDPESGNKSTGNGSQMEASINGSHDLENLFDNAKNTESYVKTSEILTTTTTTSTNTNTNAIATTILSNPIATTSTTSYSDADDPAAAAADFDLSVAVHYFTSFHRICVLTALIPLVTLFTCFVTAYVFQYDDVHETHCRVYNIVPSISAITGISPQRYFWRFSIALHLGPRFHIAFVYNNYYHRLLNELNARTKIPAKQLSLYSLLITVILILNCIEISALGGVTYISNRENYPMHEKIFITFMTCSLLHMLATIKLHGILYSERKRMTHLQRESIKWKKILFAISIGSTIGLLIFFAKHRFFCHELAFSWFAFFEYVIAVANMMFHLTIIWDFPSQYMVIVQGPRNQIEQKLNVSKKKLN